MSGAEIGPHRRVVSVRSRISKVGDYSRVTVEVIWEAGRPFVQESNHARHTTWASHETRQWLVAYSGKEPKDALAALKRATLLAETGGHAPPDWPTTLTP